MISIIKTTEELRNIIEIQKAKELSSRKQIAELVNKLQSEGKEFTILSIQDENDGSSWYVTEGIRRCNNIGYYVLEGKYTLKEELEL